MTINVIWQVYIWYISYIRHTLSYVRYIPVIYHIITFLQVPDGTSIGTAPAAAGPGAGPAGRAAWRSRSVLCGPGTNTLFLQGRSAKAERSKQGIPTLGIDSGLASESHSSCLYFSWLFLSEIGGDDWGSQSYSTSYLILCQVTRRLLRKAWAFLTFKLARELINLQLIAYDFQVGCGANWITIMIENQWDGYRCGSLKENKKNNNQQICEFNSPQDPLRSIPASITVTGIPSLLYLLGYQCLGQANRRNDYSDDVQAGYYRIFLESLVRGVTMSQEEQKTYLIVRSQTLNGKGEWVKC